MKKLRVEEVNNASETVKVVTSKIDPCSTYYIDKLLSGEYGVSQDGDPFHKFDTMWEAEYYVKKLNRDILVMPDQIDVRSLRKPNKEIWWEYANEWLTVEAMAKYYKCTEEYLSKKIDQGRIDHNKEADQIEKL